MSDTREAPARPPGAASLVTPAGPVGEHARVLLLECRLEEMRGALELAREEADRARTKLAEASAREAEQARRNSSTHEELAEARLEIAALHRHLEHSEALRAEVAGRLFESGAREDAEELVKLRRTVITQDQRVAVSERTVARLRARVEELVSSRETLLTRVAEWQQLVREDGPEAADLSEFFAQLRGEILDLEHHNLESDAREAALRERLATAGIDPAREPPATDQVPTIDETTGPTLEVVDPVVPSEATVGPRPGTPEPTRARTRAEALAAELRDEDEPTHQADLLLRLGRSGDPDGVDVIRPWTASTEASVRAAAYEALGRLLEHTPAELEPHLRAGLSDPDAHVRRRVALAVAGARGLAAPALLQRLREDADPQVRRLVRRILVRTDPPDEPPVPNQALGD